MFWHDIKDIREWIELLDKRLCSIDSGLDHLGVDADRQAQVILYETILDKFEDYMKNVEKLNSMINEFKGCVSMARGALEVRKELEEQTTESMMAFIRGTENIKNEYHDKIDAIFEALCKKKEKKKPLKRKMKRVASPASLPE